MELDEPLEEPHSYVHYGVFTFVIKKSKQLASHLNLN
ncbi:hypothetical protein DLD14_12070 [Legionella anisa]|nr:hypothetical protein DLD14_12070 [Legionella anisa]